MRKPARWLTIVAATTAIAGGSIGLAACGDSDDSGAATTEMTMTDGAMEAVATETPAADLRVTLDRLLGEHALLATVAMQKGYDGADDFEAAAAALDDNTIALGEAIGSVYGDEAEEQFLELWRQHIGFFVDYTVATAEDDQQARMAALESLDGYRQAFATFLGNANPEIDPSAVAEGLQMHVNQLTGALDAYADGKAPMAYADIRESYAHMFGTGDLLAGAIASQQMIDGADAIDSPAVDLRVTLDRLLGEHAALATVAMQKGYDGAEDFDAAAAALDDNTIALGEAIGSVYGDEAEEQFLELWRQHIGFFVDYTVATAEDDQEARAAALEKLDGYRQGFAAFLGNANPNIEPDTVAAGLQMHVDQLTGALDTYADGDYDAAYAQIRESYAHMFGTGDLLAGAIVTQMPEQFKS